MSMTVYKEKLHLIDLALRDKLVLRMQKGASIVRVSTQYQHEDGTFVWYLCDHAAPKVYRTIHVVPTGGVAPEGAPYLGTEIYHRGSVVLHFFDGGESEA